MKEKKASKLKKGINFFVGIFDIFQDIILHQVDREYMIFDNALNIYSYSSSDNCVHLLPDNKGSLYGVELTLDSTEPLYFALFSQLVSNYSHQTDARITLFYSKNTMIVDNDFNNKLRKQSVYLFSNIKGIVEDVADFYSIEIMNIKEIQNALLDIGLFNEYYNDDETFDVFSYAKSSLFDTADKMAFLFKTYFAEGVYSALGQKKISKKNYEVYESRGITQKPSAGKPDFLKAMGGDWSGYIAINIFLNHDFIKKFMKDKYRQSNSFDTDTNIKSGFKYMNEEVLDTDVGEHIVTNFVAVIDNPIEIKKISESLNLAFTKKSIFTKKIVYNTPLISIDSSMSSLSKTEDVAKYIQTFYKKNKIEEKEHFTIREHAKNMYGRDLAGNYTTYSFHETGGSPHWCIVASTRSGKTFFLLKFLQQSLNVKLIENLDTSSHQKVLIESASNLGDVQVVMFDIGSSAVKWIKALKSFAPDRVTYLQDDLSLLRFSLTDIKINNNKIDEEDFLFSVSIINLILKLNEEVPLTASESTEFGLAFRKVVLDEEYTGLSVSFLRKDGGYENALILLEEFYKKKLKKEGREYTEEEKDLFELMTMSEFGELPKSLSFLQKPIMKDVINSLDLKTKNTTVSKIDIETCQKTIKKLRIIESNPYFSNYSKENFLKSDYFYMELEKIKNLGEKIFIPIFMLIFQKLYRRDIENALRLKALGQTPPKVIYSIEEANNFTKIPILTDLLDMMLREGARYNISLGFISQKANDFDSSMLYNIGSRIIMPSEDTSKQIGELEHYWGEKKGKEESRGDGYIFSIEDFFKKKAKRFYAFIKNGAGLIIISPLVSKKEEWLFNSNPIAVKEEDDE